MEISHTHATTRRKGAHRPPSGGLWHSLAGFLSSCNSKQVGRLSGHCLQMPRVLSYEEVVIGGRIMMTGLVQILEDFLNQGVHWARANMDKNDGVRAGDFNGCEPVQLGGSSVQYISGPQHPRREPGAPEDVGFKNIFHIVGAFLIFVLHFGHFEYTIGGIKTRFRNRGHTRNGCVSLPRKPRRLATTPRDRPVKKNCLVGPTRNSPCPDHSLAPASPTPPFQQLTAPQNKNTRMFLWLPPLNTLPPPPKTLHWLRYFAKEVL